MSQLDENLERLMELGIIKESRDVIKGIKPPFYTLIGEDPNDFTIPHPGINWLNNPDYKKREALSAVIVYVNFPEYTDFLEKNLDHMVVIKHIGTGLLVAANANLIHYQISTEVSPYSMTGKRKEWIEREIKEIKGIEDNSLVLGEHDATVHLGRDDVITKRDPLSGKEVNYRPLSELEENLFHDTHRIVLEHNLDLIEHQYGERMQLELVS